MSAVSSGPVVVITGEEARMLWQEANLNQVRIRCRSENTALYKVISNIYQAGLLAQDAADGNPLRQSTASEKTEYTTVRQVAREVGISERTVRLHLAQNILPATKNGRQWIITTAAADVYVTARRHHKETS